MAEGKFPGLTGRWQRKPEIYGPALLGHWMGLDPLPPRQLAEAKTVLIQHPPNCDRLKRGLSSWNWDWMIGAAELWRPDSNKLDMLQKWACLLEAQTGGGPQSDTRLGLLAKPTPAPMR
jgi:hypothetical protein